MDESAASYRWNVDLTAPEIIMLKKPSGIVSNKTTVLEFNSNDELASFEGKSISDADYSSVSSPLEFEIENDGEQRYMLRALDLAGNATELSLNWTVDTTGPKVTLVFPSSKAISNSDSITLRGNGEDESDIETIRINGVEVQTQNNFKDWQITLPLIHGENLFQIVSRDSLGNIHEDSRLSNVWHTNLLLENVYDVAYDSESDNVYVADAYNGIFSIKKTSAEVEQISSWECRGNAIQLDKANYRLIVLDRNKVCQIDLKTHETSTLSSSNIGDGPLFVWPRDIVYDSDSNTAYVNDMWAQAIFKVDLTTGDREILSSNGNFDERPREWWRNGMALDKKNNRLLEANRKENVIYAIDLSSGERSIFSQKEVIVRDIFLDTENERLLAIGYEIYSIDLETGVRSKITSIKTNEDQDIQFGRITAIWYDNLSGTLFGAGGTGPSVVAIDTFSGEWYDLANHRVGNGSGMAMIGHVLFNRKTHELLTTYYSKSNNGPRYFISMASIDPTNGSRLSIFGSSIDRTERHVNLVNDTEDNLYIFSLFEGQLYKLNREDKLWSPISLPNEDAINYLRHVAVDDKNKRVLVLDKVESVDSYHKLGILLSFDLTSGDKNIISGPETGSGPSLVNVEGLAFDSEKQFAYVLASSREYGGVAIIRVHLDTGERVIVSSENIGSGPSLCPHSSRIKVNNNNHIIQACHHKIISVNLNNGERVIEASWENLLKGGSMSAPTFDIDESNQIVFLYSSGLKGVLAIDLAAKEYVIISR